MLLSISTIIISVVALVVSTIGSLASARQARNVRVAMDLNATVEVLLREFGNEQFQRDQIYVLTSLSDEHDHALGFDGLPDEVRLKVWRVGFAYENLGMLLAFGLLDQRIVLTIANYRCQNNCRTTSAERTRGPGVSTFPRRCAA